MWEQRLRQVCVLQAKQEQLDKQKQVLGEHQQVLDAFLQHHPSISVTKYVEELSALDKSTADTQEKWVGKEYNFIAKCQYNCTMDLFCGAKYTHHTFTPIMEH